MSAPKSLYFDVPGFHTIIWKFAVFGVEVKQMMFPTTLNNVWVKLQPSVKPRDQIKEIKRKIAKLISPFSVYWRTYIARKLASVRHFRGFD